MNEYEKIMEGRRQKELIRLSKMCELMQKTFQNANWTAISDLIEDLAIKCAKQQLISAKDQILAKIEE